MEIPSPNFLCPISHRVMRHPVITEAGHSYEYAEIQKWFLDHNTDPLTRNPVSPKLLRNHALRCEIDTWCKQASYTERYEDYACALPLSGNPPGVHEITVNVNVPVEGLLVVFTAICILVCALCLFKMFDSNSSWPFDKNQSAQNGIWPGTTCAALRQDKEFHNMTTAFERLRQHNECLAAKDAEERLRKAPPVYNCTSTLNQTYCVSVGNNCNSTRVVVASPHKCDTQKGFYETLEALRDAQSKPAPTETCVFTNDTCVESPAEKERKRLESHTQFNRTIAEECERCRSLNKT